MANVVKTEKLFLAGPAGRLEALLDLPGRKDVQAAAVVLHPHPLHEGTMLNKVAYTLARGFVQLGAPTLRFNFRGVGKSEGQYADAVGETDDALAALDWMQARWPNAGLWLGGFSFGAQVALRAANQRPVSRLVTVAPPVQRFAVQGLERPPADWLLIQGDADEVVDAEQVLRWARAQLPPPTTEVLSGAGHYFHGRLNELRNIVLRHLAPGNQS